MDVSSQVFILFDCFPIQKSVLRQRRKDDYCFVLCSLIAERLKPHSKAHPEHVFSRKCIVSLSKQQKLDVLILGGREGDQC